MLVAMLVSVAMQAASAPDAPPQAAPVQEIARNVFLLPGGIPPGRQPDGATVIFAAPRGLVVVDTGRHVWHSDAILAFASARQTPVAAIINTHWHLDHVSGNRRVRAAYPGLRVYASNAIDRAIGGFLARSAASARQYLDSGRLPATLAEDVRGDLETFAVADTLRPDVVVTRDRRIRIAGRRFDVRLARNAATDGDVWLYDHSTRVAVLGDLVTLPVPFLDTACPQGWRAAMADIWATPFEIAVPGHGAPMTRDQFAHYRAALDAFIDCAGGAAEASLCADGWARDVGSLLASEGERALARDRAAHYVAMLRENGGRSPDCAA